MGSVKSINLFKTLPAAAGVILTFLDIVKAHGGAPIDIGIKVETKEGNGTTFTIKIPISQYI